jgi:hypothetical protein
VPYILREMDARRAETIGSARDSPIRFSGHAYEGPESGASEYARYVLYETSGRLDALNLTRGVAAPMLQRASE